SSAFAALKNRLNSVSAIGYLHAAPRTYVPSHVRQKSTETKFGVSAPQPPSTSTFDRPNRLKPREEGTIKWGDLLEKFRSVQEKAKKASRLHGLVDEDGAAPTSHNATEVKDKVSPEIPKRASRPPSAMSGTLKQPQSIPPPSGPMHKPKSSLGHLGRFAGGVAGRNKAKK
ncbi:MAG: hypothetical protein Q9163_006227, partial [Psora crenata]